ncbi:hypothetical protein [Massilia sp. CFBP 13647]|nr:hypothetical protein [Massilia sp. CFBP 13647]
MAGHAPGGEVDVRVRIEQHPPGRHGRHVNRFASDESFWMVRLWM